MNRVAELSSFQTLDFTFMQLREAIATSYLAHGMSEEGIDLLASMGSVRAFSNGDNIVVQDDEDDTSLMILASGSAEIHTIFDEPISVLKPGMPFGEVALLDEKPRSATVCSVGDSEVVVLPAESLRQLISSRPDIAVTLLLNLAKILCARMRTSNQQIAAFMSLEELHEKHG